MPVIEPRADGFAGAKSIAPVPALVGKPQQRLQGIAHHVGATAFAAKHAIDLEPLPLTAAEPVAPVRSILPPKT